ncbi:hypothetical protein ABKV19_022943 [Rosa sericea]
MMQLREERLGTASPEVDDEKRMLADLLKETGRLRNRKARSLENFLKANSYGINNDRIKGTTRFLSSVIPNFTK